MKRPQQRKSPLPDRTTLSMYTIYRNCKDYPDHEYVVRRWEVPGPVKGEPLKTDDVWFADSLAQARKLIPLNTVKLDRAPSDAPVVVETWL